MKNVIKTLSILLLASGMVFTSCKDKDKDKDKDGSSSSVSAPTNLSVADITESSAKLTWSGTADSYEIVVGSKTYTASTTLCAPDDLTPSTSYAWKVRAKVGNNYSSWVEGPNFSTTQAIPSSVTVQFGSTTWTAAYARAVDQGTGFTFIASQSASVLSLPSVYFFFKKTGTTTYSLADAMNGVSFAEYWEKDIFSFENDPNEEPYGDWWAAAGSINVTSATASKVSGTAELLMVNMYQYVVEGREPEDVDAETLTVTFQNVDIGTTFSAIKSFTERKNFSNGKNFKSFKR